MTVPHSPEIERAVLGGILIKEKLTAEARQIIPEEDFHLPKHRQIWNAFLECEQNGLPIDTVALSTRVNGLLQYVLDLARETVTAANLSYHIRLLKEASLKRRAVLFFYSLKSNIDAKTGEEVVEEIQNFVKTLDSTGSNRREINWTREVERFISVTDGDFTVTDCYKALQTVTGVTIRDKSTIRQILKRLKDDTKIQKSGSKDGVYRRVDDRADEIDWLNASTEPLPLCFPLDVEKYAAVYPKNIVIIAGEPNSGKTAFLLNLALMTSGAQDVLYLSSEMGATELKTRISKFDAPLSAWKKIKFRERAGNFADVINPVGFNIVDFLELHDDFYRIGALIKEIYDKLETGICVIAIQKNKGRDVGRGGELGLEKPRLYLAMEQGKLKIVKCKAWAKEGVNPNGLQREFKLVQGAKFIAETPWHKEGEI